VPAVVFIDVQILASELVPAPAVSLRVQEVPPLLFRILHIVAMRAQE
jgi:hypothetical protein